MKEVILASASERRSRILSDCGIAHRVMPSGVEESVDKNRHVSEIVQINAAAKAEAAAGAAGGGNDSGSEGPVVIGADTLVVHGRDCLGKPDGEDAARDMLKRFSGTEVEVYTGLCVILPCEGKKAAGFEKSSLRVALLTDSQVERYFRLLGPYDKAGGFSIEGVGSLLFDNIRGSYFNILGLPMIKLRELFEQAGLDILDHIGK
ncbi:MAG: septum formation protein Maf [Candidatus Makaraimicrobium thalassicum]|nr:MAG: septum formation protein Maf [Candidatus Omnitrophota bacterium]